MKFLKKNHYLSLVLGLLIIAYGILSRFIDHPIFNLDKALGLILIGMGLLAFAVLVVLPPLTKKQVKGLAFVVITIEFIFLVYGAISGFILPAFEVSITTIPFLSGASEWFGFALVLHSSIKISLNSYEKLSFKKELIFVYLILLILGVIVYERNLVGEYLDWLVFIVLMGVGLLLTLIGLLNKKGK